MVPSEGALVDVQRCRGVPRTSPRLSASPSPAPSDGRDAPTSICSNGRNAPIEIARRHADRRCRRCGSGRSRRRCASISTRTRPPRSVNFTALVNRFRMICRNRTRSPRMTPPSPPAGPLEVELDAGARCPTFDQAAAGLDLLRHVQRFEAQHQLAGFHPRQVQDVIDQGQQMVAAGPDVGGVAAVLVVTDRTVELAGHHLREADDGVQRSPQLMAHGGQEHRFRPVRRQGCVAGPRQLVRRRLEAGVLAGELGKGLRGLAQRPVPLAGGRLNAGRGRCRAPATRSGRSPAESLRPPWPRTARRWRSRREAAAGWQSSRTVATVRPLRRIGNCTLRTGRGGDARGAISTWPPASSSERSISRRSGRSAAQGVLDRRVDRPADGDRGRRRAPATLSAVAVGLQGGVPVQRPRRRPARTAAGWRPAPRRRRRRRAVAASASPR